MRNNDQWESVVMRGIYYTGIFLIVASVITLALLLLFPQAFPANVAATVAVITGRSAGGSEDRPSPFEEKEVPAAKTKAPQPQPPPPPAPEGAVTATVEPAPVTETARFPVARDITTGMTKSVIVATFGPPEASVSGADGLLRERLVYLEKKTGRKTFIFFTNGSVSGAETTPQ